VILVSVAYAMAPTGGDGAGGGFATFIPLILMLAIFYFILLRPQQQRAKKLKEMLSNLKKDDMVVTTGGIHGKITGITETIVTLEVSQNPSVKIKLSRGQIAGMSDIYKKGEE
jgi:preprotein translocase subunit YajC